MTRFRLRAGWPGLVLAFATTGCGASASPPPPTLSSPTYDDARASIAPGEGPPLRDVDSFVAEALRQSPEARAALARWDAAHARVRASRRWPRPTLGYTYMVRPLHTRAGPLRQRVQFGWPLPKLGEIASARNASEARVVGAAHRFATVALAVREAVVRAYWERWAAHERGAILEAQTELLTTAAEVLRARLATGSASLAALQQLELRRTRLLDALASVRTHEEHHTHHLAILVEAEALPPASAPPPAVRVPSEDPSALLAAVAERPEVGDELSRAIALRAEAAGYRARRRPEARLQLEWSEVGSAPIAGVANDGADAVGVGVMVALPLDVGSHRAAERAVEAEARAADAASEAVEREARLEVHEALADVRNSARRARLHETTLEPQAGAAYESATARLAIEGDVTLMLLALRELLEVRLAHVEALAAHAIAWARLERAVGRPVEAER